MLKFTLTKTNRLVLVQFPILVSSNTSTKTSANNEKHHLDSRIFIDSLIYTSKVNAHGDKIQMLIVIVLTQKDQLKQQDQ